MGSLHPPLALRGGSEAGEGQELERRTLFLTSLLELTETEGWTVWISSHDIEEVERFADRVIAWGAVRSYDEMTPDPENTRRGPVVFLANEFSGSDGDIINARVQAKGIGPVIGVRTWGGVVGIDGRYELVDGTKMGLSIMGLIVLDFIAVLGEVFIFLTEVTVCSYKCDGLKPIRLYDSKFKNGGLDLAHECSKDTSEMDAAQLAQHWDDTSLCRTFYDGGDNICIGGGFLPDPEWVSESSGSSGSSAGSSSGSASSSSGSASDSASEAAISPPREPAV